MFKIQEPIDSEEEDLVSLKPDPKQAKVLQKTLNRVLLSTWLNVFMFGILIISFFTLLPRRSNRKSSIPSIEMAESITFPTTRSLPVDVHLFPFIFPHNDIIVGKLKITTAQNSKEIYHVNDTFHGKQISSDFVTYRKKEDFGVSGAIIDGKYFSIEITRSITSYVTEKKPNVLELGSNIGTVFVPTALYIKEIGGQILGLDANVVNYALGWNNIVLNDIDNGVMLNRAIVQDSNNPSEISFSVNRHNRGDTRLGTGWSDEYGKMQESKVNVKTVTVNELFRANEKFFCKVNVWKLDIQGFEGQAFLGGDEFLSECPPCYILLEIVFEWMENNGTPFSSTKKIMDGHGYTLYWHGKEYTDNEPKNIQHWYSDFMFAHRDCPDPF